MVIPWNPKGFFPPPIASWPAVSCFREPRTVPTRSLASVWMKRLSDMLASTNPTRQTWLVGRTMVIVSPLTGVVPLQTGMILQVEGGTMYETVDLGGGWTHQTVWKIYAQVKLGIMKPQFSGWKLKKMKQPPSSDLTRTQDGTFDGSEIPRPTTGWMYKNPVNNADIIRILVNWCRISEPSTVCLRFYPLPMMRNWTIGCKFKLQFWIFSSQLLGFLGGGAAPQSWTNNLPFNPLLGDGHQPSSGLQGFPIKGMMTIPSVTNENE